MAAAQAQAQLHRFRAVAQALRARLAEGDGLRMRQRAGMRALFHGGQITTGARKTVRKTRAGRTWT
ncbi:hypothetical protein GCM10010398_55160 [Streptomyces fimbriatus]